MIARRVRRFGGVAGYGTVTNGLAASLTVPMEDGGVQFRWVRGRGGQAGISAPKTSFPIRLPGAALQGGGLQLEHPFRAELPVDRGLAPGDGFQVTLQKTDEHEV